MRLPTNHRDRIFWLLNIILGAALLVELLTPRPCAWLELLTVALATVASMVALNRQLPLQNVFSAALIAAVLGSVAHGFSARTSIPLGPVVFNTDDQHKLFGVVPWTIPQFWIFTIFTARGVGRLILRPWRKVKTYGYWLIGLTSLLATAFAIALEPFAWHVKHLWLWQPTRLLLNWHGVSLLAYLGWGFVSLLILMFITPSLIKKQPGSSRTSDYHPLGMWLGALLLFAVGAAEVGLWWATGADLVIAAATTFFALRGAKW